MLSDGEIVHAIERGWITISPYDVENVQPASVDLRLGWEFIARRTKGGIKEKFVPDGDTYDMPPWSLHLGTTVEWIALNAKHGALVAGKSSLGRLGLQAENAGYVDPGFKGQITLELVNMDDEPVRLHKGMRICQIVFHEMRYPSLRPYGHNQLGSHYQGQRGVTGSALHIPPPSRIKVDRGPVPADCHACEDDIASPEYHTCGGVPGGATQQD